MSKKDPLKHGYVTKQNLIIAVCLAFSVGFIGGIVLTAYKSSSTRIPQAKMTSAPGNAKMLAALETETQKNPENAAAWTQLGNMYFDNNKFSKAIYAYQKAIALQPDDPNVHTDLGIMYRRNGEPRKAVESFERAIQADFKHEVSRYNKGIVLLHDLNDIKGAIKVWEELVAVNPVAMAPNGQSVDELIQHYKSHVVKQKPPP